MNEEVMEEIQLPLSDDPHISSAALSISFHVLDQTFGPEFTHQSFPGEYIRGYQPRQDLIPKDKCHKSYEHHDYANQEVSIHVQLAPSCQACTVEIDIRKKRVLRVRSQRPPKRSKKSSASDGKFICDSDREEERLARSSDVDESSSTNDDNDDESDFSISSSDEYVDDGSPSHNLLDPEGTTRKSRMSRKEIIESLQKALPDISQSSVTDQFLSSPIGTSLYSYSRKGQDFVISFAKGKEAAFYHRSVQRLALFFIENADDVDIDQEDGGYWRVLYLFRKHSDETFSLAGYVTLFHFSSPFRRPVPGTIVRICQAVVLPPYQRAGHGRELLHKIHDLIHGHFDSQLDDYSKDIVEINVEDPAPGFVVLRNLVEWERYKMSLPHQDWFQNISNNIDDNDYFNSITESVAMELSRVSKLTAHQMKIIYEINRFENLVKSSSSNNEKFEKEFRLMVKRRLNQDNKEELASYRNKEIMKLKLDEMFVIQKALYERILQKAEAK